MTEIVSCTWMSLESQRRHLCFLLNSCWVYSTYSLYRNKITCKTNNLKLMSTRPNTQCRSVFSICDSTHRNGPVGSEVQNWLLLFPKWLFFISILVQKFLKSDIVVLKYGTIIDNVITNWWKIYFEKKALKFVNLGKVLT